MSCPGGRLADLVDGRLAPAAHEQVLAHVAACEPCRAELVALRSLRALLSGSPGPHADPDLTERLTAFAITGPIPVVRVADRGTAAPEPAGRGVRTAAALAGGLTLAGAAIAWGMSTGAATQGPAATPIVPAVDRYSVEHAATTDDLPLAAPGSSVSRVAYGPQGPAGALSSAASRLRP